MKSVCLFWQDRWPMPAVLSILRWRGLGTSERCALVTFWHDAQNMILGYNGITSELQWPMGYVQPHWCCCRAAAVGTGRAMVVRFCGPKMGTIIESNKSIWRGGLLFSSFFDLKQVDETDIARVVCNPSLLFYLTGYLNSSHVKVQSQIHKKTRKKERLHVTSNIEGHFDHRMRRRKTRKESMGE